MSEEDSHKIAFMLRMIDKLEDRNREMSVLITQAMGLIRENALPWQRRWTAKVLVCLELAKIKGGGK